jgi:hypothetical protein
MRVRVGVRVRARARARARVRLSAIARCTLSSAPQMATCETSGGGSCMRASMSLSSQPVLTRFSTKSSVAMSSATYGTLVQISPTTCNRLSASCSSRAALRRSLPCAKMWPNCESA